MSHLHFIFIRHGQASFHKDNYDQLSDLGCTQIQKLSIDPFWSDLLSQAQPQHVYMHVGELQRQQHSLKIFLDHNPWCHTYHMNLLDLSSSKNEQIVPHPAWNEFEFKKILAMYHTQLFDEPQVKVAIEDSRIYAFHYLISRWMLGTLPHGDDAPVVSWALFRTRIVQYFQSIIQQAWSAHTSTDSLSSEQTRYHLCFTSAGVITALLSECLQLGITQSLALLMQLKNSSITQVKVSFSSPLSSTPSYISHADEISNQISGKIGGQKIMHETNQAEFTSHQNVPMIHSSIHHTLLHFNLTQHLSEYETTLY